MPVSSASLGAVQPQTKNPVKCQMQKGTVTFTYDDGSQTSVTCKDGKYIQSGHVKPGSIGAYKGFEMTEEEAKAWFKEEASKLPGSKKLNVQA